MTTPLPPTGPPATRDTRSGEADLAALYQQLPPPSPAPDATAPDATVLRAAARAAPERAGEDRTRPGPQDSPREPANRPRPKPLLAITARSIPFNQAAARRRLPRWLIGLGSAASLVLVAGLALHTGDRPDASRKLAAMANDLEAAMASAAPSRPTDPKAASQTEDPGSASAARVQTRPLLRPPRQASHSPPIALPGLKTAAPGRPLTAIAPYPPSSKPVPKDDRAAMEATRRAVRERHAASVPRQPAGADEPRMVVISSAVMDVTPASSPAPNSPQQGTTTTEPGDTPEQALAQIRQLVHQHRQAEATQRLQAFHRAYPQWRLPEDLRALLDEP